MQPEKFETELEALADFIGSRSLHPLEAVGILTNIAGQIIWASHHVGELTDSDVAKVLTFANRMVRARAQGINSPTLN